jgi:hypothetical protein
LRNLIAKVEERLTFLRQTKCAELAKAIEKNHATVSRDRENLGQWRAEELLIIARVDPHLRHAVIEAISPGLKSTENPDVFRTVVEELGQMAALSKTISLSIADSNIDADEARVILQDVHMMVEFMSQTLIPVLERAHRRDKF